MDRMDKNKKVLLVALLCLPAVLLTTGCDYARMTSDESYDTYESRLPVMPPGSVSTVGGVSALRLLGPQELSNPFEPSATVLDKGRLAYGYFCNHCHGPGGQGKATVGQSFAPLPTSLTSEQVRVQDDGELFFKIGLGFKRHPPLINTMTEADIWAVILYMRQMKGS